MRRYTDQESSCSGSSPARTDAHAVDSLPASLDLTLVARRPARLTEQTFRTVTNGGIPVAGFSPNIGPVKASIAVVTFNNLAFTRMCLASVLANTNGLAYEVIIVDNASGDGTADYLRAVAAANPHVRIFLNDKNRGFAPANNQALAQATGDVLVLLNNDTIVPPGWLAGLLRHLEDLAVGLVGPVTNRIGNEAEIDANYTTYGEFLDFERHIRRQHYGQSFDIPTPCMFCLALRRDAFARIGPLDERFELGMLEDDDYALRARAAGYRLVCAEDVFIHHFGQASFGALVPTGVYGRLLETNQRRFEEKWGQRWKPYSRRQSPAYEAVKHRLRQAVCAATPPGATVLVVSKGDEELLDLLSVEGRRTWHFPQAADGSYAGFYPADSEAAIAHLASLRAQGAGYLFFPRPAFWWLEHYPLFKQHLKTRCRLLLEVEESCVVFGLQQEKGDRSA